MEIELKPCAHCGADAERVHLNNGISVQIRCTNRKCNMRTMFCNEELASRIWNRRQDEVLQHVESTPEQMGYEK